MDRDGLLAANAAFYKALAAGDLAEMDALWSREAGVAVIHPGWPAITGRTAVMESWRGIFTGGRQDIAPISPEAYQFGDSGFVIVYEGTAGIYLVASNLFVREDGAWRMVHHQSGPIPAPEPDTPLM